MAYVRKNLTPEERHENAVRAARAVKNHRGGRPKGWTKDPALKAVPPRTMTVREPDYRAFSKMAWHQRLTLIDLMHNLAEALRRKHPDVFEDGDGDGNGEGCKE